MTTPDLAHQLLVLRQEFVTKLPAKLAALEAVARASSHDPEALVAATALAHRLRGSAGSFGQPAVGMAVGRIEELLELAAAGLAGPGLEEDLALALSVAATAVAAAVAGSAIHPSEETR